MEWPSTSTKTVSQPLCVNQSKELVYRECLDGGWGQEPECSDVQTDPAPECPDGFEETQEMCYKFTLESVFPPPCPFQDVLHFYSPAFMDVLMYQMREAVWLPVTRNVTNGLEFLRWVEPTTYYKEEFTDTMYYTGGIKGKDCLVYNTTGQVNAVSCQEKHRGICAYEKLNVKENKLCGSSDRCRQSEYFSKTTCFCVEAGDGSPKAEFVQPYQNSLNLTQEVCAFGLERSSNGTYLWSTSKQEIAYTYWSPDAVFSAGYNHGVVTPSGWTLTPEAPSCSLVARTQQEELVEFELIWNSERQVFILTVVNPLWVETTMLCFTDADASTLLYVYQSLSPVDGNETIQTYTFLPVRQFPGQYWCEAFAFSTMELIQTEKIFYAPKCLEFVTIFWVAMPFFVNPLGSQVLDYVNRTVLTILSGLCVDEVCYVPRVLQIVDLNEQQGFMIFDIHFTSSVITNIPSIDKEKHFRNLKSNIESVLFQNTQIEVFSFLSSDFCLGETIYYESDLALTWPTTQGDETTVSEEFCFLPDGDLATNTCTGDFTFGYSWSNFFIDCTILKTSSVSEILLPLYYDTSSISDDNIKQILQLDDNRFSALDVFLLQKIYDNFFKSDFVVDTFRQAVAQILRISRSVLLEAQVVARSTDKFVLLIDDVITRIPHPVQIVDNEFAIFVTSDACGVVVLSVNGLRTPKTLQGNCTLDRLLQIDNLELAIWLSPELRKLFAQNLLGFSIFFGDTLFTANSFSPRNVSVVFGLHLWYVQELPEPVSIAHKIVDDNSSISCLYWVNVTDYISSFWMESTKSYNRGSYRICDFKQLSHFAFDGKSGNVTDELEDLLNPHVLNSEKVSKLAEISEKYDDFDSHDVFLVAKILDLVRNNSDTDLNSLAKTVDNLHRIEKSVLARSQDKHKSTDLILDNIDNIVRSYGSNESEVLITTDNFIVFVSGLNDSDLSGLSILETNESVEAQVLRGAVNVDDIEAYQNFSSSVLLSPDLKYQLEDDSRVIITVFFNDVLFNEKQSTHEGISRIFGVILPRNVNYSGPISILHNISSTHSMECAHWNYSTDTRGKSYWKKDSNANSTFLISQCDFWHTTHFALLLLNNERYLQDEVLYWITVINSSVSLVGVLCILITALCFEKWRCNLGNQILLNFAVAIIVQIITFYIAGTTDNHSNEIFCTVIGILLHYSTISEFCWMLSIGFLQFRRFVKVFVHPISYPLLKACVLGWILPVVPVLVTLLLDDENYVKASYGLCYPSGSLLYIVVWIPIGVISTINLVIFVYIIYSVTSTKVERVGTDETKYHWRLFVLLFFMLGLTWCFGFLSWLAFGAIFAYLFCGLATLQGFVLFLYFIVFNSSTRRLYVDSFKKFWYRKNL